MFYFMTSFDVGTLDKVRINYTKVVSDKELCEKMISELTELQNNSATHLAYLGGLQTIQANHVFSPISKLKTFNKGKKNIEQAIKSETENAELRFIRLSIQYNVPKFLGYSSDIDTDKNFVLKNFKNITNKDLKRLIRGFFEDSDLLAKDEQSFIQ